MGPFDLLEKIVTQLECLGIRYFVTGSVASMAYGEPRLTKAIDIVAEVFFVHVKNLLMAFPHPEFYISKEAIEDAICRQGQFNIIHPSSGLKINVIIKKNTEFDDSRFDRIRRILPAETYMANFASPEDVMLKKWSIIRRVDQKSIFVISRVY